MLHLTPFAISGLLIFVSSFSLIIVLLFYGKQKIHRLLILFNLCLSAWGLGSFLTQFTHTLFFWKVGFCGVIFSTVTYSHLVYELVSIKNRKILILLYFTGVLSSALTLTNYIELDLQLRFNSIYFPLPGNITYLIIAILWHLAGILGFVKLYEGYQKASYKLRNQISYVFIASLIAFTAGIFVFLTAFGFNIYPYANFFVAVYGIIITYAILKHQLLDIKIVIQKSMIYSILIAHITIIYFIFIYLAERLFQNFFGYKSFLLSLSSATIIAILFIPLRNKIQSFVERYFFKGTPIEIAEQNELLKQEVAHTEKYKMLSNLASGLAHEIKNPLTAIRTFTEYFPTKKDDPQYVENFTRIVGAEIGRIDNLVHQLLDFAKPAEPSFARTDIHQLIKETLELLNNRITKSNIKVSQHFETRNFELKADTNQLKQALLNVVINAIDAMPTGGCLRMETCIMGGFSGVSGLSGVETTTNTTNTTISTNNLIISIKDSGKGIAPSDLPKVFDPFFSKKDGGTGLGLAITKNIIENHKGKIKVNSRFGEGTEFIIELPVKTGA